MHCMALLKVQLDGTATLSNLDEKPNWNGLTTVSLAEKDNTVTGKTVADLRAANGGTYQSSTCHGEIDTRIQALNTARA